MTRQDQADSQVNRQKSSPRAVHAGRDGEAAAGDRLAERGNDHLKPARKRDRDRPAKPS